MPTNYLLQYLKMNKTINARFSALLHQDFCILKNYFEWSWTIQTFRTYGTWYLV